MFHNVETKEKQNDKYSHKLIFTVTYHLPTFDILLNLKSKKAIP